MVETAPPRPHHSILLSWCTTIQASKPDVMKRNKEVIDLYRIDPPKQQRNQGLSNHKVQLSRVCGDTVQHHRYEYSYLFAMWSVGRPLHYGTSK
jgi:hypothetical protein